MVSNNCCSLPFSPSVRKITWRACRRGTPAHGAGIVDDQDDLAWSHLFGPTGDVNPDHGRRHEGERVVGVADPLAKQPDRRRAGRGRRPAQLEVAIGRHPGRRRA